MKSRAVILLFVMAFMFSCSAAYGATDELLAGMGRKFVRGVVNVLTGWLELPMQVIKGYNSERYENKMLGAGAGLFKGVYYTVGRTAWGAVELVGFWAANPEDNYNKCLPLDSEYAWEQGRAYSYFEPDFSEATLTPVGRKFLRGLGNGLFGFAEFPGQIVKGVRTKAPDAGILKGLWFWYSREVYGIADMATAIFPALEDNPGYAFDREYPWDALVDEIEE